MRTRLSTRIHVQIPAMEAQHESRFYQSKCFFGDWWCANAVNPETLQILLPPPFPIYRSSNRGGGGVWGRKEQTIKMLKGMQS